MKVQFELLLFIFCMNLAVGLCIALALPGTEYANPANNMDVDDYEEHFNATEVAGAWQQSPFSGIPIIGDIYAGFNFLWQNFQYLVDGVPTFLLWVEDSYITDANGRLAFEVVANVLRALYALLVTVFVIEFISGRVMSD